MWLFLIFLFFIFFGAWAVQDDAKIIFCEHDYEYEGDSFSEDDTHYGRYYTCNKCGKKIFISYYDWNNMKYRHPQKYEYWKNRPYSQGLKDYINRNNMSKENQIIIKTDKDKFIKMIKSQIFYMECCGHDDKVNYCNSILKQIDN